MFEPGPCGWAAEVERRASLSAGGGTLTRAALTVIAPPGALCRTGLGARRLGSVGANGPVARHGRFSSFFEFGNFEILKETVGGPSKLLSKKRDPIFEYPDSE